MRIKNERKKSSLHFIAVGFSSVACFFSFLSHSAPFICHLSTFPYACICVWVYFEAMHAFIFRCEISFKNHMTEQYKLLIFARCCMNGCHIAGESAAPKMDVNIPLFLYHSLHLFQILIFIRDISKRFHLHHQIYRLKVYICHSTMKKKKKINGTETPSKRTWFLFVCAFLSPFLKRLSHLNACEIILSLILIICYKKWMPVRFHFGIMKFSFDDIYNLVM